MRHLKAGRRLGRKSAHRTAMYRNMATSLILHGRIRTTEAKAKELRRVVERVITMARRVPPSAFEGLEGEELAALKAKRVHLIRHARNTVRDREALRILFHEYSEHFKARPGGYTRILKVGHRTGDKAPMVIIELVGLTTTDAAVESSGDAEAVEQSA